MLGKRLIATSMVVILGLGSVGEAAFADPRRYRDREQPSEAAQWAGVGLAAGLIIFSLINQPKQPTPTSTFIPGGMTFGTYGNDNTTSIPSPSISEELPEFPRIRDLLLNRGYSLISYDYDYMRLENRGNGSTVIVSTRTLPIGAYSRYGSDIAKLLADAGFKIVRFRGTRIEFVGFFVSAN